MTGAVLGNHMGYRSTAILGGILNTAGMIGGSFTTRIYQMYFTNALAGKIIGIVKSPAMGSFVSVDTVFADRQDCCVCFVLSPVLCLCLFFVCFSVY
jgi:hypothetical protein